MDLTGLFVCAKRNAERAISHKVRVSLSDQNNCGTPAAAKTRFTSDLYVTAQHRCGEHNDRFPGFQNLFLTAVPLSLVFPHQTASWVLGPARSRLVDSDNLSTRPVS